VAEEKVVDSIGDRRQSQSRGQPNHDH
jgi:hypothetical protein